MSNSLKVRLVSTKTKSKSLRLLQKALTEKLKYKVWRSAYPKLLQNNLSYSDCKNKIFQYKWFEQEGINALPYTTDYEEAKAWVEDGKVAFARLLTKSSEGKGIVVCETIEQMPLAPVYTLYKKKKQEFRVHVFKDQVVTVLEKRKKKDYHEDRDTRIRNTANGYVFCSNNIVEPPGIRELAIKAGRVTGSNFKGVDIGFNELLNELFVIEVNSAPGIQGSNISKYVEVICNE